MTYGKGLLRLFIPLVLLCLNACSGPSGIGGTAWKEEVVLHDGQTIVVERHSSRGGRHELNQGPPIKAQSVSFSVPGSDRTIVWKSEYSQDVGRANFSLRAVHVLNGTPYIVAEPNLCQSFNKWGRPNPPYVFFRHDGKDWQRIPLAELPAEFKEMNVVISIDNYDMFNAIERYPVIPAKVVKELNQRLRQPEYKAILREPIKREGPEGCPEMIPYGDGGWLGIEWFSHKQTKSECFRYCETEGVEEKHCPCERLFQEEK